MSTSITTIILTATPTVQPTGTSTVVKLARATSGSITRNIEEMRRMVIEEPRTNLAVKVLAVRAELGVQVAPVVRAALAELGVQVAPVVRVALAELGVPVAPVVRAALAELGVPVAPAALVVQVVELELSQVEEELELAPVVEVPGHPLAQLVVLRGTKSVTAAHPLGLLHLAVGVLEAVVVETSLAPAAAGAAAAWAAAE
jgi:hypothetical protein